MRRALNIVKLNDRFGDYMLVVERRRRRIGAANEAFVALADITHEALDTEEDNAAVIIDGASIPNFPEHEYGPSLAESTAGIS